MINLIKSIIAGILSIKWYHCLITVLLSGIILALMTTIACQFSHDSAPIWKGECFFKDIDDEAPENVKNIRMFYQCDKTEVNVYGRYSFLKQTLRDRSKPIICVNVYNDWYKDSIWRCALPESN